jgi:putative acetyltransferase
VVNAHENGCINVEGMQKIYQEFLIRDWHPDDRARAAQIIGSVLADYSLVWEPDGADQDVLDVETSYLSIGGEFWVIEQAGILVGTAAYRPFARGDNAVEIRKMYLLSAARGKGLGRFLLAQLETAIAARGFTEIWVETASALKEAVQLYESSGYIPATGVETARCDRIYRKNLRSSL